MILNSLFGFGNGNSDINKGNNLEVRIDTANAFTTFNKVFLDRQKALAEVKETSPVFIIPEWWGDSDPAPDDRKSKYDNKRASYTHQMGKSPDPEFYESNSNKTQTPTELDKEKGRIPIREVFIKTNIIISAFKKGGGVQKVIEEILKEINDDIDVYKWKIRQGDTDTELKIVDANFLEIEGKIESSGNQSNIEDEENAEFSNLFEFDVMSGRSIVKNYDISFDLPSGNIGNMYAIQAMSHDSSIFPMSDFIDQAIGLSSLDPQSLSIIYKPYPSSYRADQIALRENVDSSLMNVYQNTKELLLNDTYKISAIPTVKRDEYPSVYAPIQDDDDKANSDKSNKKLLKLETERASNLGYKICGKLSEYYNGKAQRSITQTKRPTLLPIKLRLTIYGIASIIPGDTFRVSYLPSMYKDRVYFQVMKVTHDLNNSSWETNLEAQFRLRPEKKQFSQKTLDKNKVILNPKIIEDFNLKEYFYQDVVGGIWRMKSGSGPKKGAVKKSRRKITELLPYMRNLRVHQTAKDYAWISAIFSFTYSSSNNIRIRFPYAYEGEYHTGETVGVAAGLWNQTIGFFTADPTDKPAGETVTLKTYGGYGMHYIASNFLDDKCTYPGDCEFGNHIAPPASADGKTSYRSGGKLEGWLYNVVLEEGYKYNLIISTENGYWAIIPAEPTPYYDGRQEKFNVGTWPALQIDAYNWNPTGASSEGRLPLLSW